MEITRLNKPLSYWLDNKDTNIVYVLYESFTSWDKVLLGKIKLNEESLNIFCGDNEDDRSHISSFIDDADSPKSVKLRPLGNGYYDSQIKIHSREIVESTVHANPQNYRGICIVPWIKKLNFYDNPYKMS